MLVTPKVPHHHLPTTSECRLRAERIELPERYSDMSPGEEMTWQAISLERDRAKQAGTGPKKGERKEQTESVMGSFSWEVRSG